ncbi:MAG: peptidoglycan DD-metalloendopeptidase family protein [Hyphomicrobium sp.]|jgi:septal ring factor EnvC (AmiA/AmiB activator)|nr:peptidoglycan DD-metalloendopeptidase family protein [Hyphomicrobium sp.]
MRPADLTAEHVRFGYLARQSRALATNEVDEGVSRSQAKKQSRCTRAATGPKRPERTFVTAAALTTLALAASIPGARAQTATQTPPKTATETAATPQSAESVSKTRDRQQHELEAKEKRDRELQSDLARLSEDRREINARLVETAARVQASEEKMTAVEDRLAGFERQEKAIRDSLAKEHGKISGLLAALQRMGRNPPPVIITRREDALRMVRSAMLIGVAFPGLKEEAKALSTKLTELVSIMTRIRRDGETLRAEREKLNAVQAQLASLLETKKQTLAERQTELRQVRESAAEISKNVSDLSELISKLSQQVNTAPAMPQMERENRDQVVAVLPPSAAPPAAPVQPAPSGPAVARDAAVSVPPAAAAPQEKTEEVALLTPSAPPAAPEPPSSSIVELAPTSAGLMPGNPDRIRPAIAFQNAKGKLSLPARGRRVLGFGEKTQYGGTSKGMVIETRYSARVTSPCDGWVVYAGEFRSYGQLLIINAGGGYHVLVAGLSRMDVGPGQFVLAAEPIGTMSGAPRTAQLATESTDTSQSAPHSSAPVLYIEFRKDGQPIDSNPWWAASHQKVQD